MRRASVANQKISKTNTCKNQCVVSLLWASLPFISLKVISFYLFFFYLEFLLFHLHFSIMSIEEGNGSCLENPMDGGAC